MSRKRESNEPGCALREQTKPMCQLGNEGVREMVNHLKMVASSDQDVRPEVNTDNDSESFSLLLKKQTKRNRVPATVIFRGRPRKTKTSAISSTASDSSNLYNS